VSLLAACSSSPGNRTDNERAGIAAAVDSATRAFEAAQRERNPELAIAHLAPDFYMYLDGRRVGYDSVAATIRRTLPTFRQVEPGFSDVAVTVLSPTAAFVSLVFHDSVTSSSGQLLRSTGPTTLVWERRNGRWLIIYADADHYTP
jgi:ketosteroid isomerase-like protein